VWKGAIKIASDEQHEQLMVRRSLNAAKRGGSQFGPKRQVVSTFCWGRVVLPT
jgi:hypothetical protein